ncbi:MAG: hypothetical protein IJW17_04150 [Lentisphaeria bacterium]|nr:hypothetical protein [Lentisphaeria bacterium]
MSKIRRIFEYLFGSIESKPLYDPDFQWIEDSPLKGERYCFSHSGGIGDILFSLYFCKEFSEKNGKIPFDFHIRTHVSDAGMGGHKHPFGTFRMTTASAGFLKGLLEEQPFTGRVTIGDELPENAIDLDRCRELKINFAAGDIHNWYYNLCRTHLPREFWKPVLTVQPDFKYQQKVLFTATERYQNVYIDFSVLKDFKDELVFAGTPEEYRIFTEKYFPLEYAPCNSMLELARYMAGAKGLLGNQSGIFSTADCLKIPRILLAPEFFKFKKRIGPGPHVNLPQGGWCEDAGTTEKMLAALSELLDRQPTF